MLALGHLVDDSYTAFLAPLLPIFMDRFGFGKTMAGILSSVHSLSISLGQPLIGAVMDRLGSRPFIVIGPMCAAVFASLFGLAPGLGILVALIFLGGLGPALFHPAAGPAVVAAGGRRANLAMGIFAAGGTLGPALGAFCVVRLVRFLGLERLYVAMVPGLLAGLMLYLIGPALTRRPEGRSHHGFLSSLVGVRPMLWRIMTVGILRAATFTSIVTFIPVLLKEWGYAYTVGGTVLAFVFASAAVGTLVGSGLADKVGAKGVIVGSFALAAPLLGCSLLIGPPWAFAFLAAGSFALQASNPVEVALGMRALPAYASTAAGVLMGGVWGLGGLFAVPVGVLADATSTSVALMAVCSFPFLAACVGATLPIPRQREP